jgi:hypothetical protein
MSLLIRGHSESCDFLIRVVSGQGSKMSDGDYRPPCLGIGKAPLCLGLLFETFYVSQCEAHASSKVDGFQLATSSPSAKRHRGDLPALGELFRRE